MSAKTARTDGLNVDGQKIIRGQERFVAGTVALSTMRLLAVTRGDLAELSMTGSEHAQMRRSGNGLIDSPAGGKFHGKRQVMAEVAT